MKIGIVGLGLIGGSIGLKLKSLKHTVYGITNNSFNTNKAKDRKLADIVSQDYSLLKDCSIVILALPIKDLLNPSQDLIDSLPRRAIITDVGSVKTPILKIWEKIHPLFIGSHPMAGTEEKGVSAGNIKLFDNAKWILTPTSTSDKKSIKVLYKLFESMGCYVSIESPLIHDQAVALISHLPIYISSCLIETANIQDNINILELSRKLASTGFSDTSRIGGGNAELGVDLAKNNTKNIIHSLKKFKANLSNLENILENGNWDLLLKKLKESKQSRDYFCK